MWAGEQNRKMLVSVNPWSEQTHAFDQNPACNDIEADHHLYAGPPILATSSPFVSFSSSIFFTWFSLMEPTPPLNMIGLSHSNLSSPSLAPNDRKNPLKANELYNRLNRRQLNFVRNVVKASIASLIRWEGRPIYSKFSLNRIVEMKCYWSNLANMMQRSRFTPRYL